ncbi:ATP-binding protein [Brevundimonas sp.]|uniref:PAS domain-containing hybrid sensor histidine kinase/response regulator n=1 Tax=Brevundimonas sp. TaxID=1871086 RepID=UPI003D6D6FD3
MSFAPVPSLTGQPTRDHAADLATFFDVSLDLLVIRDLAGFIVRVSASWAATLGYRPEDLIGLAILTLVHPDDLPGTRASVVEVEGRRPGDPVLGHVNRYRHRDGHYVTLEWRAQRFGDRIYAVARDVTAKIAAEQALIEAKSAAEAANRAKSDFLANMSHEIRTPLNGVIGIVDALSRTPLSPDQAEMVDLIAASGVTLERLVSDILDVSRIEAGKLELELRPFDLDEALAAPLETLRMRAEDKGLAFHVERPAHVRGAFVGDSVRIGQILGNLLSNAVKFTAEGSVCVRFALSEEIGAPTLLSFEIEDTGVGFDADHAAQLFQRFSQADSSITRRFGGTGLGLSICRFLTEMMGGRIEAASTPGVGSRFRVELPLPRAESPTAHDAHDPAASARPSRRLRVLLAEDNPINQRVVQLILADHAAELIAVDDGAQAVAAFEAGAFDLVLMDMQMPGMDGLTATRALRAVEAARPSAPRTPILMLSANAMAEHRDAARAAGADLHLAKPVTARDLLTALAMLVPN